MEATHRLKGRIEFRGGGFEDYVFEGDTSDPLTFQLVAGVGYVYRGGKGNVTRKSTGVTVTLPPSETSSSNTPPATDSRLAMPWDIVAPPGCYWECTAPSGCEVKQGGMVSTYSRGMKMTHDPQGVHKNPSWSRGCQSQ